MGNKVTRVILKAHTLNRAGSVKLRSADPRDTPIIDFPCFEEGSDTNGEDLEAMVDSIEFARRVNTRAADAIKFEVLPGLEVQSRADDA
jgi:choline dehydrogenase